MTYHRKPMDDLKLQAMLYTLLVAFAAGMLFAVLLYPMLDGIVTGTLAVSLLIGGFIKLVNTVPDDI